MKRRVLIVLLIAIAGIAALALTFPEALIAPGPIADAHRSFARDCQACHVLFAGPSAQRCTACHKIESIGITTVAGAPLQGRDLRVPFHQYLTDHDCLACHREHEGMRKLAAAQRFSHELLMPGVRNRCDACHRKPDDELHGQIAGSCAQCHTQSAWRPATFDHDRYFPLTGEHRAACSTCHNTGSYRSYTCYGCHAHSPERIRAEHEEEGIRRFENCVDCHRSGTGEDGEGHKEGD
jgi:hypothetical protein